MSADDEEEDDEEDDDEEPIIKRAFKKLPPATHELVEKTKHDPREEALLWTPKKIVTTYTNVDGVCCLTILFALSSGVASKDNSGVEIEVTENGWELTLAERWNGFMLDTENFYNQFPKDPRESDDEFIRRRFAMMDTVRTLKANGQDDALVSQYRQRLPFCVDPTEKRVTYTGTSDGAHFAHVDLAERKQVRRQHVIMIDRSKRSCNKSPGRMHVEYSSIVNNH